MNNILLSKNKYTNIAFGNTDKHSEQQYRLFVNKVKLKQKNYINALVTFVNIFNTFVTEKFKDEKDLWLIVNTNQTANLNLLDAKDKIIDFYNIINELENSLINLEKLLQPVTGFNTNYASIRLEGDFVDRNQQDYNGTVVGGNLNCNSFTDNKVTNPLVYIISNQIELKYKFTGLISPYFEYTGQYGDKYTWYASYGSTLVHCILSI